MRTRLESIVARGIAFTGVLMLGIAPLLALQPPPGQEEYLPIDQLPPTEQLPGGVFVVIAYGFIWVALIAYLWSIWRRLSKVESEMHALQRRAGGGRD